MDFDPENQFEDGFYQIEDKRLDQEAKKLKGFSGEDENPRAADEGIVQNPASAIRVCDFCGRTFNNGKALGGHRRYHLQVLKKEAAAQSQKVKIRLPKTKIHNDNNDSSCVNDAEDKNIPKMEPLISNNGEKGKPTCDLCHKDFPSMKSYYGHMRSHPERNRKAVSCSPKSDDDSLNQKEDSCATGRTEIAPDDESPIHLTKSLPSWAKTDQRGRKSIGGAEAAQNLVYLSRGGCFSAPQSTPVLSPHANSFENVVDTKSSTSGVTVQRNKIKADSDSPSRKQKGRKIKPYKRVSLLKLADKIVENDDACGQTVNGGKDLSECDDDDDAKEEEEEGANWGEEECQKNVRVDHSHLDVSKMMTKKKENKRKRISELKSPESSESEEDPLIKTLKAQDGHKCSTCGKSFATLQALGGHRSSHKNIMRTMDGLEDNNGAGIVPPTNEAKGSKFRGPAVEEADTAKALGDHVSRLYSRRSAETPMSEEASSARASRSLSALEPGEASPLAPRTLDFDLNKPYVADGKTTFSQE